jgi:small multidrug resistance pump
MEPMEKKRSDFSAWRPWFFAAAAYNLVWGSVAILSPSLLFDVLDIEAPNYLAIWQVVGMFVLVFAPAYWWAARYPGRHPHLIVIGMLGKLLGPIGFGWAVAFNDFPAIFGVTIVTNDLIWYPAFLSYLWRIARERGGWWRLLSGE